MAKHCRTCGKYCPRAKEDASGGISANDIIHVAEHKEIDHPKGVAVEKAPQLIAQFQIYRNGGADDFVCDDCCNIGLRWIKERVDEMLTK